MICKYIYPAMGIISLWTHFQKMSFNTDLPFNTDTHFHRHTHRHTFRSKGAQIQTLFLPQCYTIRLAEAQGLFPHWCVRVHACVCARALHKHTEALCVSTLPQDRRHVEVTWGWQHICVTLSFMCVTYDKEASS